MSVVAVLFIIAKKWKQPKCLSAMNGKQRWYIHIKKCYLAIKRNEVLVFPASWVNLENIK